MKKNNAIVPIEHIQSQIIVICDEKVILDRTLAEL